VKNEGLADTYTHSDCACIHFHSIKPGFVHIWHEHTTDQQIRTQHRALCLHISRVIAPVCNGFLLAARYHVRVETTEKARYIGDEGDMQGNTFSLYCD
jgi:hypothetical protein